MPVIGIPTELLERNLKRKYSSEELVSLLQTLGCDVEGYATLTRFQCHRCDNLMEITETENPPVVCDSCGVDYKEYPDELIESGTQDVLRMELLAVRPDMFDPGGLARAINFHQGQRKGLATYVAEPGEYSVTVDKALSDPSSYRPKISCAVVRGVQFDQETLKVVMKLQENLHWALGRNRKRASIGVYDLEKLQGRDFHYAAKKREDVRFIPLAFQEEFTAEEVLERHPKGVAYADLLEGWGKVPLLLDGSEQVMSMPPIINGEYCRVTLDTNSLFIDVTGPEQRVVDKMLTIFVSSLAELFPEVHLELVTIHESDAQRTTPDFTPQTMELSGSATAKLLGIDLNTTEVAQLLERMGHETVVTEPLLPVRIAAYRNDILHPRDLMEDVAIAYGYQNIEEQLVPNLTVGDEDPAQRYSRLARQVFTGLNFFEVMTLILSNEQRQFTACQLPEDPDRVIVEHPISQEQTMIRRHLMPGLLDTLAANTDVELPQSIFEVGFTSKLDAKAEVKASEYLHVAAVRIGHGVDFTAIQTVADAFRREMNLPGEVVPSEKGCFLPGRGAEVHYEGSVIGWYGELNPEVLGNFELSFPVAFMEFCVEPFLISS